MPPVPPTEFETLEIAATANIENSVPPATTIISIQGHQFAGDCWQYRPTIMPYEDGGTAGLSYRPICPANTNETQTQTLTAANTAVFPQRIRTIIQNQNENSKDPRDWTLHSVNVEQGTGQAGSWNTERVNRQVPVNLAFEVQSRMNRVVKGLRNMSQRAVAEGGLSEQVWTLNRIDHV
jgi:hypothetical protein